MVHVYALHCCMLHLGNTADSSFFYFQVLLVLKEIKTQSNNEESLNLMIRSHKKDAIRVHCPLAGTIGLMAQDLLATKSPGKPGCGLRNLGHIVHH